MNIRHGDLALIQIATLPEGLTKSASKILMTSSGGNNHSFDNGEFYLYKKDSFIFGYLVAKDTTLYHLDHGEIIKENNLREAKIEDGIYELSQQNEDTNSGMKPVID